MKSDWLEAFQVFGEELNFTRASERLHISQPALHVKIGKLGDYVGKSLYQKSGRNLILTTEGRQLLAFAREHVEQSEQFLEHLRTGSSEQKVCLSAGEGAYLYLLGNALSVYLQRHPSGLNIRTGDQQTILNDVLSGDAHLGISPMKITHEELACQPYARVGQILVMRRGHRLASKRKINLGALNGERLIVPPEGRPHRVLVNRLLMDANVEWNVGVEVSGWELMISFVRQGLGLAIVNEYCNIPDTLVAKPIPDFPSIQFQLIRRKQAVKRPSVDELEDILLSPEMSWKHNNR
ncbi:MAG: LysR family transcriptional regulator [Ketobacter sp.]|nr:LysR family transcriptional regulator [Ketobacter sp.]